MTGSTGKNRINRFISLLMVVSFTLSSSGLSFAYDSLSLKNIRELSGDNNRVKELYGDLNASISSEGLAADFDGAFKGYFEVMKKQDMGMFEKVAGNGFLMEKAKGLYEEYGSAYMARYLIESAAYDPSKENINRLLGLKDAPFSDDISAEESYICRKIYDITHAELEYKQKLEELKRYKLELMLRLGFTLAGKFKKGPYTRMVYFERMIFAAVVELTYNELSGKWVKDWGMVPFEYIFTEVGLKTGPFADVDSQIIIKDKEGVNAEAMTGAFEELFEEVYRVGYWLGVRPHPITAVEGESVTARSLYDTMLNEAEDGESIARLMHFANMRFYGPSADGPPVVPQDWKRWFKDMQQKVYTTKNAIKVLYEVRYDRRDEGYFKQYNIPLLPDFDLKKALRGLQYIVWSGKMIYGKKYPVLKERVRTWLILKELADAGKISREEFDALNGVYSFYEDVERALNFKNGYIEGADFAPMEEISIDNIPEAFGDVDSHMRDTDIAGLAGILGISESDFNDMMKEGSIIAKKTAATILARFAREPDIWPLIKEYEVSKAVQEGFGATKLDKDGRHTVPSAEDMIFIRAAYNIDKFSTREVFDKFISGGSQLSPMVKSALQSLNRILSERETIDILDQDAVQKAFDDAVPAGGLRESEIEYLKKATVLATGFVPAYTASDRLASDVVTKEDALKALDDISKSAFLEKDNDELNRRKDDIAKKIAGMNLIRGKKFFVIGPGEFDYLGIVLAKLGLSVTEVDTAFNDPDRSIIAKELGMEDKFRRFNNYEIIKDEKFDYVSILGVVRNSASEKLYRSIIVEGGRHNDQIIKEASENIFHSVFPLVKDGGHVFFNEHSGDISVITDAAYDVAKSLSRTIETVDVDVDDLTLNVAHLGEERKGFSFRLSANKDFDAIAERYIEIAKGSVEALRKSGTYDKKGIKSNQLQLAEGTGTRASSFADIYDVIKEQVDTPDGKTLLDMGSGLGTFVYIMDKLGINAEGVEINAALVNEMARRLKGEGIETPQIYTADITDEKLADIIGKQYDITTLIKVGDALVKSQPGSKGGIEPVSGIEWDTVMRNINRLTKTGGIFIHKASFGEPVDLRDYGKYGFDIIESRVEDKIIVSRKVRDIALAADAQFGTDEEVEEFSKNSKYKEIVYHSTILEDALSIKESRFKIQESGDRVGVFGPGIYTTPVEMEAKKWLEAVLLKPENASEEGYILSGKVNISNPKIFDLYTDDGNQEFEKFKKLEKTGIENLKNLGFDSIIIKVNTERWLKALGVNVRNMIHTGGNQVILFSNAQVMFLDGPALYSDYLAADEDKWYSASISGYDVKYQVEDDPGIVKEVTDIASKFAIVINRHLKEIEDSVNDLSENQYDTETMIGKERYVIKRMVRVERILRTIDRRYQNSGENDLAKFFVAELKHHLNNAINGVGLVNGLHRVKPAERLSFIETINNSMDRVKKDLYNIGRFQVIAYNREEKHMYLELSIIETEKRKNMLKADGDLLAADFNSALKGYFELMKAQAPDAYNAITANKRIMGEAKRLFSKYKCVYLPRFFLEAASMDQSDKYIDTLLKMENNPFSVQMESLRMKEQAEIGRAVRAISVSKTMTQEEKFISLKKYRLELMLRLGFTFIDTYKSESPTRMVYFERMIFTAAVRLIYKDFLKKWGFDKEPRHAPFTYLLTEVGLKTGPFADIDAQLVIDQNEGTDKEAINKALDEFYEEARRVGYWLGVRPHFMETTASGLKGLSYLDIINELNDIKTGRSRNFARIIHAVNMRPYYIKDGLPNALPVLWRSWFIEVKNNVYNEENMANIFKNVRYYGDYFVGYDRDSERFRLKDAIRGIQYVAWVGKLIYGNEMEQLKNKTRTWDILAILRNEGKITDEQYLVLNGAYTFYLDVERALNMKNGNMKEVDFRPLDAVDDYTGFYENYADVDDVMYDKDVGPVSVIMGKDKKALEAKLTEYGRSVVNAADGALGRLSGNSPIWQAIMESELHSAILRSLYKVRSRGTDISKVNLPVEEVLRIRAAHNLDKFSPYDILKTFASNYSIYPQYGESTQVSDAVSVLFDYFKNNKKGGIDPEGTQDIFDEAMRKGADGKEGDQDRIRNIIALATAQELSSDKAAGYRKKIEKVIDIYTSEDGINSLVSLAQHIDRNQMPVDYKALLNDTRVLMLGEEHESEWAKEALSNIDDFKEAGVRYIGLEALSVDIQPLLDGYFKGRSREAKGKILEFLKGHILKTILDKYPSMPEDIISLIETAAGKDIRVVAIEMPLDKKRAMARKLGGAADYKRTHYFGYRINTYLKDDAGSKMVILAGRFHIKDYKVEEAAYSLKRLLGRNGLPASSVMLIDKGSSGIYGAMVRVTGLNGRHFYVPIDIDKLGYDGFIYKAKGEEQNPQPFLIEANERSLGWVKQEGFSVEDYKNNLSKQDMLIPTGWEDAGLLKADGEPLEAHKVRDALMADAGLTTDKITYDNVEDMHKTIFVEAFSGTEVLRDALLVIHDKDIQEKDINHINVRYLAQGTKKYAFVVTVGLYDGSQSYDFVIKILKKYKGDFVYNEEYIHTLIEQTDIIYQNDPDLISKWGGYKSFYDSDGKEQRIFYEEYVKDTDKEITGRERTILEVNAYLKFWELLGRKWFMPDPVGGAMMGRMGLTKNVIVAERNGVPKGVIIDIDSIYSQKAQNGELLEIPSYEVVLTMYKYFSADPYNFFDAIVDTYPDIDEGYEMLRETLYYVEYTAELYGSPSRRDPNLKIAKQIREYLSKNKSEFLNSDKNVPKSNELENILIEQGT